MEVRKYKEDEWTMRFDGGEYGGFDDRTYTDLNDNPITGLLENFYYFKENDLRNWQYIENGKRSELP